MSDKNIIFQLNGHCITATYAAMDDGDVKVTNRGWFWWFFFSYYALEGKARASSSGNGQLAVDFNIFNDDRLSEEGTYNILATDYTSYTLVYSCNVKWLGIEEWVWMMGRDTTLSDSTKTALKSILGTQVPSYDYATFLEDSIQGGTCVHE